MVKCGRCDSEGPHREELMPDGPHYGKLLCGGCGRWMRWVRKPLVVDDDVVVLRGSRRARTKGRSNKGM